MKTLTTLLLLLAACILMQAQSQKACSIYSTKNSNGPWKKDAQATFQWPGFETKNSHLELFTKQGKRVLETDILKIKPSDGLCYLAFDPPVPANEIALFIGNVATDYQTVAVMKVLGNATTNDFEAIPVFGFSTDEKNGTYDPRSGYIDLAAKESSKQVLIAGSSDNLVSEITLAIAAFPSKNKQDIYYSFFAIDNCDDDQNLKKQATQSTTERTRKADIIRLFPNPVDDVASLAINLTDNELLRLKVVDMQGNIIEEQEFKSYGKTNYQFDTHLYPKGIYFLSLAGKEFEQAIKFVK